jgi:hypothetical protein
MLNISWKESDVVVHFSEAGSIFQQFRTITTASFGFRHFEINRLGQVKGAFAACSG